jgi:hypothetical protein
MVCPTNAILRIASPGFALQMLFCGSQARVLPYKRCFGGSQANGLPRKWCFVDELIHKTPQKTPHYKRSFTT